MNDLDSYPKEFQDLVKNPRHLGRMNAPDGSAWVKGLCGDEMEVYIIVQDQVIQDIKFFSNGCEATIACGEVMARSVCGKNFEDALAISPKQIIDHLQSLSSENKHCAILAVDTFYRAIAEYLLRP